MDAQDWLQDHRLRVAEIGARAARTRAELRAVEETATSRDGAVTVTVDPGGALRRLLLGEQADGLSRVQLAAAVLAAAAQAHELARRRADEISAAFLAAAR